ncbi:MAG: hypothetical protein H0X37_17185 [Herpetosiphonaceae bacterium]|nr:hypothetical protein [Herpetosiphonaceae bacterium]
MAITSQPMQPMPLHTARLRRDRAGSYFQLGSAGLLAGAVVVVCILSILYLAQTGRVATRGYKLQALQAEEKVLLRVAEQDQYRIAMANRLDVIQSHAVTLNMHPATVAQTRYVTIQLDNGPLLAQR